MSSGQNRSYWEVEVTGETETNERLDCIEAQLIEMNDKFWSRVFWGVLGAHIALILLGIISGILIAVFFGAPFVGVQL